MSPSLFSWSAEVEGKVREVRPQPQPLDSLVCVDLKIASYRWVEKIIGVGYSWHLYTEWICAY